MEISDLELQRHQNQLARRDEALVSYDEAYDTRTHEVMNAAISVMPELGNVAIYMTIAPRESSSFHPLLTAGSERACLIPYITLNVDPLELARTHEGLLSAGRLDNLMNIPGLEISPRKGTEITLGHELGHAADLFGAIKHNPDFSLEDILHESGVNRFKENRALATTILNRQKLQSFVDNATEEELRYWMMHFNEVTALITKDIRDNHSDELAVAWQKSHAEYGQMPQEKYADSFAEMLIRKVYTTDESSPQGI